ncbi:hypothetical protein ACKWTF_005432 [Chironomus riparius]
MRLLINFLLLLMIIAVINCKNVEEDYDAVNEEEAGVIPFTHFCKFEIPMVNHSTTDDEDFCDCDVVSSSVIGKPIVKINCEMSNHVTNLTNKVFQAQKLPINTVTLILSYQHFNEIPEFVGEHLKHLDMSNNLITIIKDENFIHVTSLEHLDLSYNSISEIQSSAFQQLQLLHYLDLSSNRIVQLPLNVFTPLSALETLKLSSNEELGKNIVRDVFNSSSASIYQLFGITTKLNSLVMTHCELTAVNLREGADLKRINLSFNNITDFSMIELPDNVVSLELSGNPILHFTATSLPSLLLLEELILEDLPFLKEVSDFSLYGFPKLHHLTFEGSRNLSLLKGSAFYEDSSNENIDTQLKIFNLRGCSLKSLHISLEPIINQLAEFHIDGNSFDCSCDMKWVKYIGIDTNLQCHRPETLNGKLLREIPDKRLKCENFFLNKLINTMILLFLLMVCSLAIWFFLRRLNPTRRNKFQKVGPESPYQRVTIEPNRAEYSLY